MNNRYLRWLFKKLKIRTTILLPMVLWIIISSLLMSFFIYSISGQIIEDEIIDYMRKTHQEVGSQMELAFRQLSLYSSKMLSTQDIHKLLTSTTLSNRRKEIALKELISDLYFDNTIGMIQFITTKGEVLEYNTGDIHIPAPSTSAINAYLNEVYIWQWGDMVADEEGQYYLPYIVKLYNMTNKSFSGSAIIYYRERELHNSINDLTPADSTSFLITKDNYIISHTLSEYIDYKIYEQKDYHLNKGEQFVSKQLQKNDSYTIVNITDLTPYLNNYHLDWRLVTEIPSDVLFADLALIRQRLIVVTLIMVFLVSIIIIKLSKSLSDSITLFNTRIQDYIKFDIDLLGYDTTKNEIVELEDAYESLIDRIHFLMEKNNAEKEKQRDLELQALQAQINPHFLYNTLDAVAWIAKMKNQTDIVDMVIALAQFFRLSLHKGDKYITVEEEIEIVKSYVFIEQIRFPNKFELMIDVDDVILDFTILKLTIQPFIENAIKHGISKKKGMGVITIKGRLVDQMILLDIIDNGIGNPNIQDFYKERKFQSGGYGILNVKERLLLEYGEKSAITIESSKETGTTIHIIIPAK